MSFCWRRFGYSVDIAWKHWTPPTTTVLHSGNSDCCPNARVVNAGSLWWCVRASEAWSVAGAKRNVVVYRTYSCCWVSTLRHATSGADLTNGAYSFHEDKLKFETNCTFFTFDYFIRQINGRKKSFENSEHSCFVSWRNKPGFCLPLICFISWRVWIFTAKR